VVKINPSTSGGAVGVVRNGVTRIMTPHYTLVLSALSVEVVTNGDWAKHVANLRELDVRFPAGGYGAAADKIEDAARAQGLRLPATEVAA
jgi:hypothetical protein